jgi:UDPglucose--hexose-1-phosphate uridylyltransferase
VFTDNPLTGEHVLVSPHRTKRPWQGQTEPPQPSTLPEYDPDCYLCPGNARAGGQRNDVYTHTMAFENDYAAVLPPPGPIAPPAPHPLLQTEPVQGGCDVLIFHPRHDLTLARLAIPDIQHVIDEWITVYRKRGAQEGIKYVQIFEVSTHRRKLDSDLLTLCPEQRCYDGLLKSSPPRPSLVSV